MRKRILSALLAVMFLFTGLPGTAWAVGEGNMEAGGGQTEPVTGDSFWNGDWWSMWPVRRWFPQPMMRQTRAPVMRTTYTLEKQTNSIIGEVLPFHSSKAIIPGKCLLFPFQQL